MKTIRLAYIGTRYNGFQYQPDAPTVEGILKKYFGSFKYLSRLDSGVSALYQLIKVREHKLNLNKINQLLPSDIVLLAYSQTNISFKDDVKGKVYLYMVPKPWVKDKGLFLKALNLFKGEHDFDCFRKRNKEDENTICKIYDIRIIERPMFYYVFIFGNRFLWNMVRRIVGTAINASKGLVSIKDIELALDEQRPCKVYTAPPEFLILYKVVFNKKVVWTPLEAGWKIENVFNSIFEKLLYVKYGLLLKKEFEKIQKDFEQYFKNP